MEWNNFAGLVECPCICLDEYPIQCYRPRLQCPIAVRIQELRGFWTRPDRRLARRYEPAKLGSRLLVGTKSSHV